MALPVVVSAVLATGGAALAAAPAVPGPAADLSDAIRAHTETLKALGAPGRLPGGAASGLMMQDNPVAVGGQHTCAVGPFGGAWCWGENGAGQLGTGDTADSALPVQAATALAENPALAVTAGRAHTCALVFEEVADTIAVHCWGDNSEGQLGDGTFTDRTTPVRVLADAVGVVAGADHTCAVTDDGAVSCWGRNDHGQLGTGSSGAGQPNPQAVPGLTEIVDLAAGDTSTCAVDADGEAWCWGADTHGQLGDGGGTSLVPQAPVEVATDDVDGDFERIAVGARHACGLTEDGGLYCWGADGAGQLGNGASAADPSAPVAVDAGEADYFSSLSAAGDSTCAVADGGTPYCWGENGSGQLGTGDTADRDVPAAVDMSRVQPSPLAALFGITQPILTAVTVGSGHSCAVDITTLYCWGNNGVGQLGTGGTADALIPDVTALGPGPATAVRAAPRNQSLQVSWQPPADSGAAPVQEHAALAIADFTGGEPSEDPSDLSPFGVCVTEESAAACTIEGLDNGQQYIVLVGTATAAGVSYSAAVRATPAAAGLGGTGGGLPVTGSRAVVYLLVALPLLAAGGLVAFLTRRRIRWTV